MTALETCPHCGSTQIDKGFTGLDKCETCDGLSRGGKPLAVDDENTARKAIVDVRKLHSVREFTNEMMAPYTAKVCAECRQVWPCATTQAILDAGASAEETS